MISLFQLDLALIVMLFAVVVFSGLVHGTLGLGFPMVATPLIAVFLDVRLAILLTLLPTAAVNVTTIFADHNDWREVKKYVPMIGASVLGALAGTWLLSHLDPNPFRLVLAILIIVFLLGSQLGRIPQSWLNQWPAVTLSVFGLLAGLSAGTTNVMVAILIIYFLSMAVPKSSMIPALNSCFLAGKIAQIVMFSYAGKISISSMVETLPLAIAAVMALFVGFRLQKNIAVDTYRQLLRLLLVVLAAILVAQYFSLF